MCCIWAKCVTKGRSMPGSRGPSWIGRPGSKPKAFCGRGTARSEPNPSSSCMQQASRRTFARYSYQARRRWCNGQARSLGDCPSPTCDKMRRFVSAENPCRPGRPRDGDFSAAARNSSQVLAHSRVTLLFFRPRLGEMLQDAGQGLGSLMQALEESFPGVETDRSDGLK